MAGFAIEVEAVAGFAVEIEVVAGFAVGIVETGTEPSEVCDGTDGIVAEGGRVEPAVLEGRCVVDGVLVAGGWVEEAGSLSSKKVRMPSMPVRVEAVIRSDPDSLRPLRTTWYGGKVCTFIFPASLIGESRSVMSCMACLFSSSVFNAVVLPMVVSQDVPT